MKKNLIVSNLFLLFIFSACSSVTQISDGQKFAKYINAESLKQHLEVIASDSMEGREMATEGERKASTYIAGIFKQLNLQPPQGTNQYLQGFDVSKDSITDGAIWVGSRKYPFKKYAYVIPFLNDNAEFITDTVIFVGYGINDQKYSDYKEIDVKNKIILICQGEPKTDSNHYLISGTEKRTDWSRFSIEVEKKIAAAKTKGAKAIFFFSDALDTNSESNSKQDAFSGYRPTDESEQKNNTFMIFGNPVAKSLLGEKKFQEISSALKRHLQFNEFVINTPVQYLFKKTTLHKTVNNVVGYVEGTDKKNEYVIVSAHYDHLGVHDGKIYHGADDNGSGTCGLMGIAEAFSHAASDGKRPHRSVIFLSVTGEEKGLFGSKNYVTHPLFPLESTVADVNTDMIGRRDSAHETTPDYIYVIGDDKLSSEMRGVDERNNSEHTKLALDYKYNDPDDPNKFYYRSDHYEFAQKKIPIIFYFDGVHRDYHKPTDTVDKIDFNLMEERARLAFYTAWEIANRVDRLKVDRDSK